MKNVRISYLCLSVFICGLICILSRQPRRRAGLVSHRHRARRHQGARSCFRFCPQISRRSAAGYGIRDVVRADLDYSGILELVSKSYNPLQTPTSPAEVDFKAWSAAPGIGATARIRHPFRQQQRTGNSGLAERCARRLPAARYRQSLSRHATDPQVRIFAHQFADEIIGKLSGGLPGIASTQIAFVSNRSGNKEIWAMDYDGANQHQLTQLHTISLTPRWSPDATRIAFTCYAQPGSGSVLTAQICIYSTSPIT